MVLPNKSGKDELVFLEESAPRSVAEPTRKPEVWRVLIIDDDEDVHTATVFALNNLEMQHRPLEFLHAYSAAEARRLLQNETDIAVILLDVVMEQDDAGLQLVRHIRDTLGQVDVRIILRTGQPGYAPEIDAIRDYDINDYKTKSELTRIKLYTTVTAAIRSYEQIRAINAGRRGLDHIVRAGTALMAQHGLPNFAAGVITQLAALLNCMPDGLIGMQGGADQGSPSDQNVDIIAAAGSYHALLNQPLSANGDRRMQDALMRAFDRRENVYEQDFCALYFACKEDRHCAAFLNTGRPLSDIEQRLLEVFCSNIAVGLDNVLLLTRLHDFAFYDQLSKLPNRTRLIQILDDMLQQPARSSTTLSIVDIDHFSETNDAFGHQFGDQLLLSVAARLQSWLGERLTVARVGGDTFAVLGDSAQVNPAMILALFNEPFQIDGHAIQLSATVGLIRLADYEGSGASVVKDADIALKRAKIQQRTGHFYFSHSMGIEIRERVKMMHALRRAFDEGRLLLAYQPQIDLATRRPIGVEALLRWQAEDGIHISPDRFIPIAEYSGLIIELGEWVLRTACRELVRLRTLGYRDFMMSVNVSQAQFRHPRFLDMLRQALSDTQAPAEFIELEITESMAMEEPAFLSDTLHQVKQLGLSIAIDDFGTGFSSLSYLQQLHVDRLKIDRAFVNEITDSSRGSSIAEMVIQLGRNLNLSVVAEGVEDERQAAILVNLGCPSAQGFLFARPMAAAQLTDWLKHAAAGASLQTHSGSTQE